ncbi:MAG: alcohol dehydrogenase catalytic domain-containing protein [Lachnospiraceae bacterium]|nr:alcohol dehydrogenase catalytic domain-containing protein [Lachnospiraceae bacterium]
MKAAVIRNKPRRIEIENVIDPVPGEGEYLIQMKAVGLCGSDVHGFLDENSIGRVDGLIMGHEPAGVVVSCGPGAEKFKPGDRVVIDPQFSCGKCYACKHAWYNICEEGGIIGSNLRGFRQGAMAEYVALKERHLHVLPDSMSFEEGALMEPVSNSIHAVNRAGVKIGDKVAVIGAGTIGLCMIQAARAAGAQTVIAVDVSEFHLELAKQLGADYVVNSRELDPIEAVRSLCGGIGSDVTIESAGFGETYRQACLMTRKRGTLVFFGAASDEVKSFHLYPILHRELNCVGCTGFDVELDMGIAMVNSGKINVKPLITHRFSFTQTGEAIRTVVEKPNEVLKVVLVNDVTP